MELSLIFCYLFTLLGVEMFRLPDNISDNQMQQIEELQLWEIELIRLVP